MLKTAGPRLLISRVPGSPLSPETRQTGCQRIRGKTPEATEGRELAGATLGCTRWEAIPAGHAASHIQGSRQLSRVAFVAPSSATGDLSVCLRRDAEHKRRHTGLVRDSSDDGA